MKLKTWTGFFNPSLIHFIFDSFYFLIWMKLKTGKNKDLSKQCTIGYCCQFDHYMLLLSAMHVGWLRRAAEATTEPFSLWRLITLNSWTLTPEWASSHHPSFLQMNQSTIVFMALCLVAGINAGLFNHRIQSHHNNVHKVIIPSTQPCHNIFTDYTPEVPLWTVARLRIWRLPLRLCQEELQPAGPGRHASDVWRCCIILGNYSSFSLKSHGALTL